MPLPPPRALALHLVLTTTALSFGSAYAANPAATPADLLASHARDAVAADPAFAPSAARGEAFFHRRFTAEARLPGCATCHTDDPRAAGKHAITDKAIRPLAPSANAERFTDPAKVDKWFRRNCRDVVGRECSAAEKADLIAYLVSVR